MRKFTLLFALVLLFGAESQATPVPYTYVGSNYTSVSGPGWPGITSLDHMIVNVVLHSELWGKTEIIPTLSTLVMTSGPIRCAEGGGTVTTNSSGVVLVWHLFANTCAPGTDMDSDGSLDGSGLDGVSYDLCGPPFPSFCSATVTYEIGSRPTDTGWTFPLSVPEAPSWILLGISLAAIVVMYRRISVPGLIASSKHNIAGNVSADRTQK
jgi:hypothetical protein